MSDVRDGAATITPLGAGRYRITRQCLPSKILLAVPAPEGVWVWEDGRAMLLRPARETDGPNDTRDDDLSLATPMPATVRAIAVHEGDKIGRAHV